MALREIIICQALLFFCSIPVQSQLSFRTAELERLISELHIDANSLHEGIQTFDVNNQKVSVVVARNMVQSVGYQLFSDEMKTAINSPALNFLERYFLQMTYPQSDRPCDRMLREDRVIFKKGSLATVATIRPDDAFSLNYNQKWYQASWSRDDKDILAISFPAVHELISGETKIESENNVENDIINVNIENLHQVDESELLPTQQKNYLLKRGGTYMNNLFTSEIYYQRQNDSLVLVSDVSHPLESVANMMIDPAFHSSLNLKLQQVLYGYKRKSFVVPMKSWIAYCKNNGCELYYGIESFDKDGVKATVVAVNTTENYNHILYLSIPVEAIDTGKGDISGTLQAFIPMHNVKSLLSKYNKVEKRKRNYE